MNELKKKLEHLLFELPGEKSLYIKSLEDDFTLDINSNMKCQSASIIKLFYLYEALKQIQNNKLNFDQLFPLPEEEKVGGSGILNLLHSNLELTLEDLLTLMIDVSDNTATNMLFDILGKDQINQSLEELGIKKTYVARKLMKIIPGVYNYTTAMDTGKILEEFARPKVLNNHLAEKAIEILNQQQFNDSLSRDLITCGNCHNLLNNENICPNCQTFIGKVDPIIIKFPHKTGEISGVVHDAGVMYIHDRAYIIAFLTKNLKNNLAGKSCMSKIGTTIYNYFSKGEGDEI